MEHLLYYTVMALGLQINTYKQTQGISTESKHATAQKRQGITD